MVELYVKKNSNDMNIATGIYVLGEFTPRIKDKITAYGEFLSSNIIAAKLKSNGLDCVWLDSRNYIKTNSNFTDAKVNFETTNAALQTYFKENKQQITLFQALLLRMLIVISPLLGRGGSVHGFYYCSSDESSRITI